MRKEAGDSPTPEQAEQTDAKESEANTIHGEWQRQSILGRMGQAIEPAVRPLGWDWKHRHGGVGELPGAEVVVGTLGVIYNEGDVDPDKDVLHGGERRRHAVWPAPCKTPNGGTDRPSVHDADALSLMVFFALCCQCAFNAGGHPPRDAQWGWPAFTFTYMTVLAYIGALAVFQIGRLFL